MRPIRERFKKFGGEYIPDIIEYLKKCIENSPNLTISVGCDSVQRRRKTLYAITIMLYDTDFRRGAHVIFYRASMDKIRDNFERLKNEMDFIKEVADFLQSELEPFYKRKDLTPFERKRYKFHLNYCNGDYIQLPNMNQEDYIRSMSLNDADLNRDYKLVDIHIDYNPFESSKTLRGFTVNKSNLSYKSFVPWLRGIGYRVWSKPESYAASSAADLLIKK